MSENCHDSVNQVPEGIVPEIKEIREEPKEINIEVSQPVANQIKILEFNQRIADAEFKLYQVKKEKADWILEQSIQDILNAQKSKEKKDVDNA